MVDGILNMVTGLQEDIGPKADKVGGFSSFYKACTARMAHFYTYETHALKALGTALLTVRLRKFLDRKL